MPIFKIPKGIAFTAENIDRSYPKKSIKVLYQSLYYLYQHYQDIYDWFFIGTDKSYIAGYRINEIVNHMSITRKLYMGHPKKIKDMKIDGYYCQGDAGMGVHF